MSRYYQVVISCVGKISEAELKKTMMDEFGWRDDADSWSYEGVIGFSSKGNLYSGESEEEAHERIITHLRKEVDASMKVESTWTCLEDLPSTTYGSIEGGRTLKELENGSKWLVVFAGKPYEETYASNEELRLGLKKFYEANKDSDYAYDFKVYRGDEDHSESQFVAELVEEILEEYEAKR